MQFVSVRHGDPCLSRYTELGRLAPYRSVAVVASIRPRSARVAVVARRARLMHERAGVDPWSSAAGIVFICAQVEMSHAVGK